jgi:outer membrane lipoprotein SlyB
MHLLSIHPQLRMNPFWLGVSLLFLCLILSGCQSTPRTGTYPATSAKAEDIQECNARAASATSGRDTTTETVKEAAIGGAGGAGVGAVGGAIGGSAGKGAAVGAVVGTVAGTLYGINENRKEDQLYQDTYRTCMQQRGY